MRIENAQVAASKSVIFFGLFSSKITKIHGSKTIA